MQALFLFHSGQLYFTCALKMQCGKCNRRIKLCPEVIFHGRWLLEQELSSQGHGSCHFRYGRDGHNGISVSRQGRQIVATSRDHLALV